MAIEVGARAPEFTLADEEGNMRSLSEYIGSWVLLYFYPKDDTPGCTTQACGIRDIFGEYALASIVVLGMSTDSVKSHFKFKEKYHLPFTLLADTDKQVVELYGVWQKKKFMGKEYMGIVRSSFLISPEGKVAKRYDKVDVKVHAQEILKDKESFS